LAAAALVGLKNERDFRTAIDLDTVTLKAQQRLAKYREQAVDAEVTSIGIELDKLIAKRKNGTFGPEDAKTERQLIARYQDLIQQSEEIKRIITQGESTTRSAAPANTSPGGSIAPQSALARDPPAPAPKSVPSQSEGNADGVTRSDPAASRVQESNSSVPVTKQRLPSQAEDNDSRIARNDPGNNKAPEPNDSPAPVTKQPQRAESPTKDELDFRFAVASCTHSSDQLTCLLKITNLADQDRRLDIKGARIMDKSGKEFHADGGAIGTQRCRQCASVSGFTVAGIPIGAEVYFPRADQADSIAVLELDLAALPPLPPDEVHRKPKKRMMKQFTVQFRDVSLGRPQSIPTQ
jgi:hypothetical protein